MALTLRTLGGLTHGGDRARLPRPRADDGAAPGARQAQDRAPPASRTGAARRRAARPPGRRARRRLPRLQRGLRARRAGDRLVRAELCTEAIRLGAPARAADARRRRARAGCSRSCSSRRPPRGARRRRRRARRARPSRTARAGTRRRIAEGRDAARPRAARCAGPGPYQLQAAIALRCTRDGARTPTGRRSPRSTGGSLHGALAGGRAQPRRRAGAWPAARTPASPLLERVDLDRYQPFHVARAELLRRSGDADAAARLRARHRAQRERGGASGARATARIAAHERSTSPSSSPSCDTEMRIARRPRHVVAASQHVPSACTAATTASVAASSSPKRTSTWLSTTSLRTSTPGAAPSASAKRRAQRAAALDQLGDAVAPERAQRRVDGERRARGARTRASSRARRAAVRSGAGRPRATPSPRGAAAGSRDEGEAAVVRDVEPLVRVGRPRVGALDAGDQVRGARARRRPTARRRRRRAPRRRAVGDVAIGVERIEGAGVDVARLRADDRRAARSAASALRSASGRIAPWSSVCDAHDRRGAEAEQPQRRGRA